MASSYYNSSMLTPVPLLGTPFNTISYFSNNLTYLPNAPQCLKHIHQRDWSSPRSPSHIIQHGQIVSSIPGLSIISVDNDSNWEDAPATNPVTNLTSNILTSSTCLWSKPCWSNNTNEQLANILGWLINTLNANQTSGPNTNSRETKAYIPDTFSSIKPNKINNFLFQCHLYFCANPAQFNMNIVKLTSQWLISLK